MTRRLVIDWPDPQPFRDRGGASITILAVSDAVEQAFTDRRNRQALQPIDLVLGCGDLDSAELAFLVDGFDAPLLHVLGNHDDPARWRAVAACPEPIRSSRVRHAAGLSVAGLPWPGESGRYATRSDGAAWSQSLRLATRRLGRTEPLIVISHAPPLCAGDIADGTYHRGFKAYRWLLERVRPRLWLHGHTPLAAARDWRVKYGDTTLVNVSGAVLIELRQPAEPAGE
jgi:Icc-related predicted phosphoesterase